jgi:glyoxylate reductase
MKPKVYFTSNVFSVNEIGSNIKIRDNVKLEIQSSWKILNSIAITKLAETRFPSSSYLLDAFKKFNPNIIGCHLSHPISQEMQEVPALFAISTATAGYNHIERLPNDKILITHTPGVLHETVADYTVALILANLRNLIDLHEYVWRGKWKVNEKWDLDQQLSSMIKNKLIGIIGMGEIGAEVLQFLHPWGIKVLYYDIRRRKDLEQQYSNLKFIKNLEDLFKSSDVITIHVPFSKSTENLIDKDLLKLMKKDSLLVNTARGGVLNLDDLLDLIENGISEINFALDVYPTEPLNKQTLKRIKRIKEKKPQLRILLMPHNASSDANTRGNMVNLLLTDIIKLIKSKKIDHLEDINIIPDHKKVLFDRDWKIINYWKNMADMEND